MRRVFTNGCFDILHPGHIELLKYCKLKGYVIVGLNSDRSVKGLKGAGRPYFSEDARKFLLEACRYVDEVIIFDEATPYNLIKKVKPDIIVKGADYAKQEVVGYDLAEVEIVDLVGSYSTTGVLEKIQ